MLIFLGHCRRTRIGWPLFEFREQSKFGDSHRQENTSQNWKLHPTDSSIQPAPIQRAETEDTRKSMDKTEQGANCIKTYFS